jgi:hypothetical protein
VLLSPEIGQGVTYAQPSSQFGGGAIGRAPYPLYRIDCDPEFSVFPPPAMLVTEFVPTLDLNGDPIAGKEIKLRFYGPVRTDAGVNDAEQPLRFMMVLPGEEIDQTHKVDITLKRGSDPDWSREVVIKGKEGADFLPGLYRVYAREEGAARLYCDQLDEPYVPSVHTTVYPITLLQDCNRNGVWDTTDIDLQPWWDDFPPDGTVDSCQYIGNCHADIDHNGFVNGDDQDLFQVFLEAGDYRADFDDNSFVNGDDFDAFAIAFNAGG